MKVRTITTLHASIVSMFSANTLHEVCLSEASYFISSWNLLLTWKSKDNENLSIIHHKSYKDYKMKVGQTGTQGHTTDGIMCLGVSTRCWLVTPVASPISCIYIGYYSTYIQVHDLAVILILLHPQTLTSVWNKIWQ